MLKHILAYVYLIYKVYLIYNVYITCTLYIVFLCVFITYDFNPLFCTN